MITSNQQTEERLQTQRADSRNVYKLIDMFPLQQLLIPSLLSIICLKSADSLSPFLLATRKRTEENDNYCHNTMKPNKNACV